jgi:hypothetical protein
MLPSNEGVVTRRLIRDFFGKYLSVRRKRIRARYLAEILDDSEGNNVDCSEEA